MPRTGCVSERRGRVQLNYGVCSTRTATRTKCGLLMPPIEGCYIGNASLQAISELITCRAYTPTAYTVHSLHCDTPRSLTGARRCNIPIGRREQRGCRLIWNQMQYIEGQCRNGQIINEEEILVKC